MAKASPFDWVISKLEENDKVESTDIDKDGLLNIHRVEGEQVRVTYSSLERFTYSDIEALPDLNNVDFILHTVKEPYINGDTFEYLNSKQKVLGGFSDLFRVINQGHNWPYSPSDVFFIDRGLNQHTKVSSIRRLDNKRYEISRHGLETVIIVALNEIK